MENLINKLRLYIVLIFPIFLFSQDVDTINDDESEGIIYKY